MWRALLWLAGVAASVHGQPAWFESSPVGIHPTAATAPPWNLHLSTLHPSLYKDNPPLIRKDKPPNRKIPAAPGKLLGTLDLAFLHNALWRTHLTVALGNRTFLIGGQESDKGTRYVTLYDPTDGQVYFLRESQLVWENGYRITVDRIPYDVRIDVNLFDPYGSRLIFEGRNADQPRGFEIRDIMKAIYEAGQSVDWEGRQFRVHYSDQIFEGPDGSIQRHERPLLVLMTERPDQGGSGRYQMDAIEAQEIPSSPEHLLQAYFRIAPYGLFSYGLRESPSGDSLELYSLP